MTQLDDLKIRIEKADVDPIASTYYQKLARDHNCFITTFHDVYMMQTDNPLRAKFMKLARELGRNGWHCSVADNRTMIFSRDKKLSDTRAKDYLRGATEENMTNWRVNNLFNSHEISSLEALQGKIEMANTALKSTSFEDQVKEMKKLGYQMTKRGGDWNLRIDEERLAVPLGEILSARARMDAYVKQMFPGNVFTHFVVKPAAKTLYYSMGISMNGMSAAVSAV